jgi:hypothetical protein
MTAGYYVCGRCRKVTWQTVKQVKNLRLSTCRSIRTSREGGEFGYEPGCGHTHRVFS